MSVQNAGTGTRANGMPAGGGYVYRGVRREAPAPRKRPWGTLPDLVLGMLAALGGAGTAREIAQHAEACGQPLSESSVRGGLNALARRSPPAVTSDGGARGGGPDGGNPRTWRLAVPGSPAGTEETAAWKETRLPWADVKRAGRSARALRGGQAQARVAAKAGLSQPTLSGFERGAMRLSAERLAALAEVFGTTVEELTGGAG